MAFDADEEILQDFLVEAGELLELLSEQLVDLERSPNDKDLLNAIFRGFHTVKGGAGFLGLTALVDVCHVAENIFDALRNGKREVDSQLMDVILRALDVVNSMFEDVKQGNEPEPAEPELINALKEVAESTGGGAAAPAAAAPAPPPPPEPEPEPEVEAFDVLSPSGAVDEITDDEFEALLDELESGKVSGPIVTADVSAPSGDEEGADISDAEFEALLDELQGSGTGSSPAPSAPAPAPVASASAPVTDDDEISEDEFDKLLDELQGPNDVAPPPPPPPPPQRSAAPPPPPPPPPNAPVASSAAEPKKPVPRAGAAGAKKGSAAAGSTSESTVRVDTKRLDDIMNMVGELVLVRNRLLTLSSSHADENLAKAIQNLDVVTADLQGAVMKTRMQPIKKVFGRFPRVVRDLARNLKKEITLELSGEETDLDKNLVEALADPLVHLVRNAVDHGIELPDVREAQGKSRAGNITLSAAQEGDHILLSIVDDGGGIDPDVLREKAVNKGLLDYDTAERLSIQECYNLIFMPGFSTREEISDVSGRGVGMDVVKTKITQLNGSIMINAQRGKGTEISIKVPLTLAILPTLMVVVGKQIFAFPLASVNEIFHLDLRRTNIVDGQLTIVIRDKALPLFYLDNWLIRGKPIRDNKNRPDRAHVVIIQVGTQQVAFVVDSLVGQEEVVIKPLGRSLQGTPGMAGATITSDGGIALILDVPSMLKHYARGSAR